MTFGLHGGPQVHDEFILWSMGTKRLGDTVLEDQKSPNLGSAHKLLFFFALAFAMFWKTVKLLVPRISSAN